MEIHVAVKQLNGEKFGYYVNYRDLNLVYEDAMNTFQDVISVVLTLTVLPK